jgi:gamma-F420-2:alpha-L-glutamate ligase
MKGWVIFEPFPGVKEEDYAIKRFKEVAIEEGIELKIIASREVDLIVSGDRTGIRLNGERTELPDFVIPRLGSRTSYFSLAVIRQLETMGVFVVNSSSSIELVKDKLYTQQVLSQNNLPVPKTMLAKFPVDVDFVKSELGFPIILKTLSGNRGVGVFLSETQSNFLDLVDLISVTNKDVNLILQEFVAESRGRDLRILTIGGKVIACIQRTAKDDSFKANVSQGGAADQYPLNDEIEWLATQVASTLGLDFAGIDLLFTENHFTVCEANSAPGFKGIESSFNINIPKELFNYIRVRLGIFNN